MKYNCLITGLIFFLGLFLGHSVKAQDTTTTDSTGLTLQEVLCENRYPVNITDSELEGQGGRWLIQQSKEATVVTLGETHGSQEIPELMTALLDELQEAGEVDHLMLEVSPWTAEQMNQRLKQGVKAYNSFIKKYPNAVPFYNFQAERNLAAQMVQKSNSESPLWGMDQIFVFSTDLALDRLAKLAPSEQVNDMLDKIRSKGQSLQADDPRLQKLPPGIPTPISAFDPTTFDTLQKHFKGIPEAQKILKELTKSIEIYRLNDMNNYASNQMRAHYLRQNLQDSAGKKIKSSSDNPQIVIKTGGRHAYRGITPNNALDVGNLAISLAERMDGKALNVGIFCGPGSKMTTFPAQTTSCWQAYKNYLGEEFGALSQKQAVLFDLSEIHRLLHEGKVDADPQLEDLLWGFDAVIFIPDAEAAKPIASPVKK